MAACHVDQRAVREDDVGRTPPSPAPVCSRKRLEKPRAAPPRRRSEGPPVSRFGILRGAAGSMADGAATLSRR